MCAVSVYSTQGSSFESISITRRELQPSEDDQKDSHYVIGDYVVTVFEGVFLQGIKQNRRFRITRALDYVRESLQESHWSLFPLRKWTY